MYLWITSKNILRNCHITLLLLLLAPCAVEMRDAKIHKQYWVINVTIIDF